MQLLRRVLYTVIFSAFFFIFGFVARDIIERVRPDLIQIPDMMTGEFVVRWIAIFTLIVLLSFWGASSVVYGNLSARDRHQSSRRFDRD